MGLRVSLKLPFYGWRENSVEHILENRQYTGCTVNGKSTTVSYKVERRLSNYSKHSRGKAFS